MLCVLNSHLLYLFSFVPPRVPKPAYLIIPSFTLKFMHAEPGPALLYGHRPSSSLNLNQIHTQVHAIRVEPGPALLCGPGHHDHLHRRAPLPYHRAAPDDLVQGGGGADRV